jgi:hypothetical protein
MTFYVICENDDKAVNPKVREKWILTLSLEEEEVIMWKGYLLEAINNEDQACKIGNKVRWRKNLNGKNEKEIDILNWMESAACDVWRRSIIKTERMLWFGTQWRLSLWTCGLPFLKD